MKIEDIKIDEVLEPPTEHQIAHVQAVLGVKLPDDYLDFIRLYHGAQLEPCLLYDSVSTDGRHEVGIICELPSFLEDDEYGILTENREVEDRPEYLIIIAPDPGEGYTCFDYSTSDTNPSLVCWIRDSAPGKGIFHAANSFTELLEKTYYKD